MELLCFCGPAGSICRYLTLEDTDCQIFDRNGVQEASSSNLDTRTKNPEQFLLFWIFYLCRYSKNSMQLSGGQLLAAGSTAATPLSASIFGRGRGRISTLGPLIHLKQCLSGIAFRFDLLITAFSWDKMKTPRFRLQRKEVTPCISPDCMLLTVSFLLPWTP